MNQQQLDGIKAYPTFADIRPLISEIERLKELVKKAYREGGDEGMREGIIKDVWDADNYLWDHSKSRKELET